MASAFIGLSVKVLLANGTSLKGHVSNVDPTTQRLMLQDVVIQNEEEKTVKALSSYSVAGGDIKDLQVLPTHKEPSLSPSSMSTSIITTATSPVPYAAPSQHHHQDNMNATMETSRIQLRSRPQSSVTVPNTIGSANMPFHDPAIISAGCSSIPFHDPAIISFKPSISPAPAQPPDELGTLAKRMSTTNISKATYLQTHDSLTMAESSATESVNRGPRRSRKTSHSNNKSINNTFDYGSSRSTHKSVSGKRSSRRYKEPVHEWAQGDTDDFKDEDFDFQHNLGLFDKAAVFAEIREADDTAPELLLVNLNRNPNRARAMEECPTMRKLKPTENVLDSTPKRSTYKKTNSKGNVHGSGLSEEDDVDESDDDSWNSSSVDESCATAVAAGSTATSRRKVRDSGVIGSSSSSTSTVKVNGEGVGSSGGGSSKRRAVKIQTLSAVACPTVTSLQMQEVERLSALEMGLSDEQMIENGGRGTAMMCLQALGGSRRIQPNNHNSAPLVVILAGNNRTGAYALCAARHLSNHGCVVLAFIAGSNHEGQLHHTVATQSRGFLAGGGELIHTIAELPQSSSPVDLIVDGLLGYQYTVTDIVACDERESVCDLMDWANDNKAPVLSLDMPSGVNGTTGQGDKTKFCVRPKWTLCLGAPKAGCRSRSTTGELFLADLGIPRNCWKKAGVKGWGMPWGADFLVGLEYV
ncbi:enhancer of mRNA decapping [Modicella reniformis]|uniref:Enhancer of mRNA-decapping protein 3 n=1 Tax=Modicella reniformis TaxID=1440133 RepID=A0A9P6STI7_9FUNG|nr:enhancer of mRNA decapping [Modicella reniformis]